MKRHLGSTLALILGVLTLTAGLTQSASLIIAGPIMILGAVAYRSAKKRYLGEVKDRLIRKLLEFGTIALIIAAVLLQNGLKELIANDPIPNLVIPLWVIIGYITIIMKKPVERDST